MIFPKTYQEESKKSEKCQLSYLNLVQKFGLIHKISIITINGMVFTDF